MKEIDNIIFLLVFAMLCLVIALCTEPAEIRRYELENRQKYEDAKDTIRMQRINNQ